MWPQRRQPSGCVQGKQQRGIARDQLEISGKRAPLSGRLDRRIRRRPIPCACIACQDDALSGAGDLERNPEIVKDQARRNRGQQRRSRRVECTADADHGAALRFRAAQELFVAPVEIHARAELAGCALEHELAAGDADFWIGERSQERAQRTALDTLPGVGEHRDLSAKLRYQIAQTSGLAAAKRKHAGMKPRILAVVQYLRGEIFGAVRCNMDAQSIRRIVECGDVGEFDSELIGRVIGDDDDVDHRLPVARGNRARFAAREQEHRERISKVRPAQREQGEQECGFHGALPLRPSKRSRTRSYRRSPSARLARPRTV